MSDNDTQNDSRKKEAEIVRQLSNVELGMVPADIEISTDEALKLPIDKIPALGVAFASLPEVFRTASGSISIPTLLSATDKFGNPIDPSILQAFNDGSGLLGSFRDAANGFGQARFHTVGGDVISTVQTMPYDPTSLFMAAALNQINQKLDAIQEVQQEMFEYMRQKDKAELRGDLQVLSDIMGTYSFNFDNDIWRKNAHMKVMDIKQEMEKAATHLRAQIKAKLNKHLPMESRLQIKDRLNEVCDRMKEYQLASHVYAFASFLEPMLSENFDERYLTNIANQIQQHALRYRELYTEAYNAIERSAKNSVDATLLGGLSFAGKALGQAIAATPVGDLTPIDEALVGAGKEVGKFNREQTNSLVSKLHEAKSPEMQPFKESVEAVNRLYNKPMQIAADSENIYLIPQETTSE